MVKTKQNRWKSKYVDNRIWKIYQKKLILQGEFFFNLNFLENWDNEIDDMNQDKPGSPYIYILILYLIGLAQFIVFLVQEN